MQCLVCAYKFNDDVVCVNCGQGEALIQIGLTMEVFK